MWWFQSGPRLARDELVFAVGDVHGCLDLLIRLQEQMLAYALRLKLPNVTVVYLGDYIDRGPDSAGVIANLCAGGPPGWQHICLRGNHEQFLLDFLEHADSGWNWLDAVNGGRATLESYGVADPLTFVDIPLAQTALLAKLPPAHRQFLRHLPYAYTQGDYYFVHAGAHPNRPLVAQIPSDQLWIREPFLSSGHDFGKVIVHGHTISAKPVMNAYRIGIDTGAYWSGTLTAVALYGTTQKILQVGRQ